jgi:hypothetical protein
MVLLLKKFLPKHLKNIIISILNKRHVRNFYKTKFKKKVLISYLVSPLYYSNHNHTNHNELKIIGETFMKLSFNVDFIHFNSKRKINYSEYDIIFGFGYFLEKILNFNFGGKIITYIPGNNPVFSNIQSINRLKHFKKIKKNNLFQSGRIINGSWPFYVGLSDVIICIGNQFGIDTFKLFNFEKKIYSINPPFHIFHDARKILKHKNLNSKKNYLWIGGGGYVHKGLDLVINYFSANKDFNLHICSNLDSDPEFLEFFKNKINSHNIYYHGFVDISSKHFHSILDQCLFVLSPSISDGGNTSLVTAIANGGLIPIITKSNSYETKYGIVIDECTDLSLKSAIEISQNITFIKLMQMARENYKYAIDFCGFENFKRKLFDILNKHCT